VCAFFTFFSFFFSENGPFLCIVGYKFIDSVVCSPICSACCKVCMSGLVAGNFNLVNTNKIKDRNSETEGYLRVMTS